MVIDGWVGGLKSRLSYSRIWRVLSLSGCQPGFARQTKGINTSAQCDPWGGPGGPAHPKAEATRLLGGHYSTFFFWGGGGGYSTCGGIPLISGPNSSSPAQTHVFGGLVSVSSQGANFHVGVSDLSSSRISTKGRPLRHGPYGPCWAL